MVPGRPRGGGPPTSCMRRASGSGRRVFPKRSCATRPRSRRLSAAASPRSWLKRCGDSRWCSATAPRPRPRATCASGATRWPGRRATTCSRRQRFEDARQRAEEALALFDQLGARSAKADAYRVIGMVYRETGRTVLAESRLRSAIELAVAAGAVLGEAEASRELALLYQAMGRNQEALRLLNTASRLFQRLDARVDLIHVGGKLAELKEAYLAVVRAWGQSIESSDSYTFGRCERVARNAVAMARVLGLDDHDETAVLLGAYVHDVGQLRIPHELLRKPGPLTREERELVQMHPIWGIELLASVEFPWDLKPIIRWHHERYDGTGYPDRLKGDEIPLAAQIVGMLDVYNALTSARAYQSARTADQALAELTRYRSWWSDRVFEAFLKGIVQSCPSS